MASCIVYGVRVMANTPSLQRVLYTLAPSKNRIVLQLTMEMEKEPEPATVKGFRSQAGDEFVFSLGVLVALQMSL